VSHWTDIFTQLDALLPSTVAVHDHDHYHENSRPPAVFWMPISARYAPPERVGGGAGDDGALWIREVTVKVRCWAASVEAVDTLVEQVVQNIHDLISQHSYSVESEEWFHGKTELGASAVLMLVIRVPLRRTPTTSRPISQIRINETPPPPEPEGD
jgi:hypothetical protein